MKRKPDGSRWCDRNPMPHMRHYALVTSENAMRAELANVNEPFDFPWINKGANATVHYFSETEHHCTAAIVAIDAKPGRTGIQVAALLCHEAVHLFQRYCQDINESEPSSEFQAYSIQWIAQELMTQYVRQAPFKEA